MLFSLSCFFFFNICSTPVPDSVHLGLDYGKWIFHTEPCLALAPSKELLRSCLLSSKVKKPPDWLFITQSLSKAVSMADLTMFSKVGLVNGGRTECPYAHPVVPYQGLYLCLPHPRQSHKFTWPQLASPQLLLGSQFSSC